jgi:hypothetical protein
MILTLLELLSSPSSTSSFPVHDNFALTSGAFPFFLDLSFSSAFLDLLFCTSVSESTGGS